MSSTFSGFLSSFGHNYNASDIMSSINYVNPNSGGDFTGQMALIVVGNLVFGWANANSFMNITTSSGSYHYGTASFPFQMVSTSCAAITNTFSNSLLSIECTSSGGNTTITMGSPNGSGISNCKFFLFGYGITSWLPPSYLPTSSGYLSNFTGLPSTIDIIEAANLISYTSVFGGGTYDGSVATGRFGNFRVAFNVNGYVYFSSSKTLTITLPIVFSTAFCFCSSVHPNVLPYATAVTVDPSSITFTLNCKNYSSSSTMATSFIVIGQV
jgi:hypothetical protein